MRFPLPRFVLDFGLAADKSRYTDLELIRIDALGRYNADLREGRVKHTRRWREIMQREQEWFDREIRPRGTSNQERIQEGE